MNRNNNQQRIIKINAADIFWGFFEQWKAILIVALIMAVLACGFKHASDVKAFEASQKQNGKAIEQSNLSQEERIEKILGALSDTDRAAVEYALREQDWYDTEMTYLEESLMMGIDPTNQTVLKFFFSVNAAQNATLPTLIKLYTSFLDSDEMAEEIRPHIAGGEKNKYLYELISTGNRSDDQALSEETSEIGTVFTVFIVLPDGSDKDGIESAVIEKVNEYSSELMGKYPHRIAYEGCSVMKKYDSTMTTRRNNLFNNINTLEKSLKNLKASMSEQQRSALETIRKIKSQKDNADPEKEEAEEKKSAVKKPGYSPKHALFGFIVGVMLYAVLYVVMFAVRGVVGSVSGAEEYSENRAVGEIYTERRKKGLSGLFHSKIVDKLRYKGKLDSNLQINKTIDALEAIKERDNIDAITLLNIAERNEASDKVLLDIIEAGKNMKVNLSPVEVPDMRENDFNAIDNAVIMMSGQTKAAAVWKLMDLCNSYDVRQLGCIYIGEV